MRSCRLLKQRGVGAMNAGPFSARLLTNAPLPKWLKEPEEVKAAARRAAELCCETRHGHRQARAPVLLREPGHRHDDRRLGESREHPQLGEVDRGADR